MTDSIFSNYWNEVTHVIGGNPHHKSMAISLSNNPLSDFDGVAVVENLYKSLDCDGWVNSSDRNWVWRSEAPVYQTSSPEVALEREIIVADSSSHWMCQMSTSSGIQGSHFNKRRAIDLVKKTAPNQYAFIELKMDSDNPLYAAFEILGYGLAYLHARKHNCKGAGNNNVMDAVAITLVVLGPNKWYEYKARGANKMLCKFNLDWLANELAIGLDALTDGNPQMSFSFKEFKELGDIKATAAGVDLHEL